MHQTSKVGNIAFVGDHLRRKCGIATFTSDLLAAVAAAHRQSQCFSVSVNDIKYRHPESVLALAMPTGRFKLEKRTLAIGDLNGKRVVVTIPAGDIVNLIADPSAAGNKMVDVLWEGRTVAVYAVDLKQRGIET